MRRRVSNPVTRRAFGRARAVNLILNLGALSGCRLLSPVSLSVDERRAAEGGHRATDLAAGVVASLPS